MAARGRTVRVGGLPTDMEEDRLKDKLLIHFLRTRNGGGEIDSVWIEKTTPSFALITFEETRVAQRLVQQSPHVLDVDGKKYKLTATEHRETLDPDTVISSLSATVNFRHLPGGIPALTGLHTSHPDVQINYDAEEFCTLCGAYSKVQAALAQLLSSSESEGNKELCRLGLSRSRSVHAAKTSHTQESQGSSRKVNKQKVHTDEHDPSSYRAQTAWDWTNPSRTEEADLQLPGSQTMSEEDFSLMLDADMFQYLQKHCRKEYQRILSQNGVTVVDMTKEGLTTLYLQVTGGGGGDTHERLKLAKKEISWLYHDNETKICRSQLSKTILSPRGRLQSAIESLTVRFPKLLLNEDDKNIYFIGSNNDVSEAKKFLLLDHDREKSKTEDVASLLRYPSYGWSSPSPSEEVRVSHTSPCSEASPQARFNLPGRSDEDERKPEGARKYKLAARFKDSGLAALSSRPPDFNLRGISSTTRQTRPGPMLGHNVLSGRAGISIDGVSRAEPQDTGGDILFKSADALPSVASTQNKTTVNSNSADTQPKSLANHLSEVQPGQSGTGFLPPAGSGSTLKRASSFSGTPQQKAQVTSLKSLDDFSQSPVRSRGRSSSFSSTAGTDTRDVHSVDVTVPQVMWHHINEAYRTRVDDLTSDVQIREKRPGGSSELTVTIRGATSDKVRTCQLGLQRLVESVSADFSVQELRLLELGINDPKDETLKACCAEVRSRFKKVTIVIMKKSLYLIGPKLLCSKVADTLREVFSVDLTQQDFSSPSTSNWKLFTSPQTTEELSGNLHWSGDPRWALESHTAEADAVQQTRTKHRSSDLSETEHVNGSVHQPMSRKDPVIREKVKVTLTMDVDGQKTSLINRSSTGSDRNVRYENGVGSKSARTDKKDRNRLSTPTDGEQQQESRSGPDGICVCGDNGKSLVRTKCGVSMCSKCLESVHVHCRDCPQTDSKPPGIRGKMSSSKLHINVPGHSKDAAIKISYCIPNGIQAEDHPSPGKPFQGGVFDAYLPDCERARRLLPRLHEAFKRGLTFTVAGKDTGARVSWNCIPHKTSLQGGKSGNGYPDSTYLSHLSHILTSNGIGETLDKSTE